MENDTIAAIASGLTQSGIGVIRISGEHAVETADRILHMKNKKLADQPANTIHYGFVYDGDVKLDEVMAVLMRAPHSFTAEDTVEIQCHGGPWVMKKILECVLRNGARPADPGEFTKRAFLNGRIDLSQAEAVMGIIRAQNEFAREASVSQLSGRVSSEIAELRSKLLYQIAYIESALDDPEHISLEGFPEQLKTVLIPVLGEIHEMIRTADYGRILAEGIRTVILGRPNAGKSSLLNQLVGEERAIVTDVAGTTRDTLEEQINLGGISLRLIDTAGIRNTGDKVEQIGVERAKKQAGQADLLIYVVDSSEEQDENDRQIIEMLQGKNALVVMNKIDLDSKITEEQLAQMTGKKVIPVSAKEGTGMPEIEQAVKDMFDAGEIGKNQQVIITNMRHKAALAEAEHSLNLVIESIDSGMPEDFYTIDLMNAYEAMGRIIGESVEDDLVNEIFSKFCMGK